MTIHLFLASDSDKPYAEKIQEVLRDFDLEAEVTVASAHKVPEKVLKKIEELNKDTKPTVIITCVGLSNGLSGVVAASSIHPVIACPVFHDEGDYLINIHSTLQMPSEVPVMTVVNPKNAALAAVRIVAGSDEGLRKKVEGRIEKVKSKYN
jgi:5-(carboxyamino)imidazole ribonucleotide mutase